MSFAPKVILGTGGLHGKDGIDLICDAVERGYSLLDTADSYGNEGTIGAAYMKIKQNNQDIKILTKLAGRNHGYEKTVRAVQDSLQKLGVDKIDYYLIHWPLPCCGLYLQSFEAMVDMKNKGIIEHIGVSNFTEDFLASINNTFGFYPEINQIELHPFFQQKSLIEFHKRHNIQTLAWSPLCKKERNIFDNPVLEQIAKKYDASVAQIILAWHLYKKISPVVKTRSRSHLEENFRSTEIELLEEEILMIDTLESGIRRGGDPATHEE